jgi:peroxiredoxin
VAGLFAVGAGVLVSLRGAPEPPLRAGAAAPEFTLPRLDGSPISLSSLRSQVVFVNFWATWCAPCRDEAPSLQRLQEGLRAEGFHVIAVSIDAASAEAEVRAFREQYGLDFPILLDSDRSIYSAYGASGVPETFLIDRNGQIVEHFVGPRDWDEPRYSAAIRRVLAQESIPSPSGPPGLGEMQNER